MHVNSFDRERWFLALGEATSILLNSTRKTHSIATIGAFVWPFAQLGQLKILYGTNRFPGAYITWGYLTDDCLASLAENPQRWMEIDELNAGSNLVIFDLLSNLRDFRPVVAAIRRLASDHRAEIYGLRYDRHLARVVVRQYRLRASGAGPGTSIAGSVTV